MVAPPVVFRPAIVLALFSMEPAGPDEDVAGPAAAPATMPATMPAIVVGDSSYSDSAIVLTSRADPPEARFAATAIAAIVANPNT